MEVFTPTRPSNTATAKLLRKLIDLVGKESADEIYKNFTMDIIRAEHEYRYGGYGGIKPHVGQLSFPIVCGNREIIIKRKSGGEVEFMFMDHTDEGNRVLNAFKGVHRLKFEEQFNELWDLLISQRDRYIANLEDI